MRDSGQAAAVLNARACCYDAGLAVTGSIDLALRPADGERAVPQRATVRGPRRVRRPRDDLREHTSPPERLRLGLAEARRSDRSSPVRHQADPMAGRSCGLRRCTEPLQLTLSPTQPGPILRPANKTADRTRHPPQRTDRHQGTQRPRISPTGTREITSPSRPSPHRTPAATDECIGVPRDGGRDAGDDAEGAPAPKRRRLLDYYAGLAEDQQRRDGRPGAGRLLPRPRRAARAVVGRGPPCPRPRRRGRARAAAGGCSTAATRTTGQRLGRAVRRRVGSGVRRDVLGAEVGVGAVGAARRIRGCGPRSSPPMTPPWTRRSAGSRHTARSPAGARTASTRSTPGG